MKAAYHARDLRGEPRYTRVVVSGPGKKPTSRARTRSEPPEDTMRIRDRRKNPLIERRPTIRRDSQTRELTAAEATPLPRASSKRRRVTSAPKSGAAPMDEEWTEATLRIASTDFPDEAATLLAPAYRSSSRPKPRSGRGGSKSGERTRTDSRPRARSGAQGEPARARRGARAGAKAEPRSVSDVIERALLGEFEGTSADAARSPKRALEQLVHEPQFLDLAKRDRRRILDAIARDPRDITTIKAASALVRGGTVRRLRPVEREHLFDTFYLLDSECRALLARLAVRPLKNGPALEDRDFQDVALISGLHALLTEVEIARDLRAAGFGRRQVIISALGSIAHPERLTFDEGADGVLSIIEFALADTSPAELVRLWTAVVSGPKKSSLAGEGALDLGARLEEEHDLLTSTRESPIRLALELLAGISSSKGAGDRGDFLVADGDGLDAEAVARALSSLYGVRYGVWRGAVPALRALERVSRHPRRVPPVFVSALYESGERLFVFDHLEDEDVFVRAPHGRSSKARGARRSQPARLVVDPSSAIDRIELETFQAIVGVAIIPR